MKVSAEFDGKQSHEIGHYTEPNSIALATTERCTNLGHKE